MSVINAAQRTQSVGLYKFEVRARVRLNIRRWRHQLWASLRKWSCLDLWPYYLDLWPVNAVTGHPCHGLPASFQPGTVQTQTTTIMSPFYGGGGIIITSWVACNAADTICPGPASFWTMNIFRILKVQVIPCSFFHCHTNAVTDGQTDRQTDRVDHRRLMPRRYRGGVIISEFSCRRDQHLTLGFGVDTIYHQNPHTHTHTHMMLPSPSHSAPGDVARALASWRDNIA